jgi:hypothetical protein
MAGLDPAIRLFDALKEDVDARVKPGHDDVKRREAEIRRPYFVVEISAK